jgi:hypothetical protein
LGGILIVDAMRGSFFNRGSAANATVRQHYKLLAGGNVAQFDDIALRSTRCERLWHHFRIFGLRQERFTGRFTWRFA